MKTKNELLRENGFMPWRWGRDNKLEGFLKEEFCQDLIGVDEDCYVAVLLDEDEVRMIRKTRFENKVVGNDKQIQIERIIFGSDKSKIYRDGRLILLEAIIPLEDLLSVLEKEKKI